MNVVSLATRAASTLVILGTGVLLLGTAASTTLAAPPPGGYTLFGDAAFVHPGHNSPTAVQATDTGATTFGGVDFAVPAGLTVSQLSTLSTDYQFTAGTCGVGSPRFSATVTNGTKTGNIFFYIGPPPNYTACPPNVWTSTGNLASPTNLVDASQIGGTFYEPYAAVQTAYGSYTVTDLALVVDNSPSGTQTAQFDNVNINGTVYTFDQPQTKNDCKNGGWQNQTDAQGNHFKNQGDCVSYVATGGKNKGNS